MRELKWVLLLISLPLFLGACGSASEVGQSTAGPGLAPGPVAGLVTLSGKVLDVSGQGVPNVRLVVEERATGEHVEVQSRADGSYVLSTHAGTYDVGLDRESDRSTATCFYGPVSLLSSVQRNFTLQSRGGRSDETVFGQISQASGGPLAFRKLRLVPVTELFQADEAVDSPLPVETTTGSDGTFEVKLGLPYEEVGFDLELYDATGGLDEFIDAVRREKPSYLEFVEGSGVRNVFRSGEEPQPSAVTDGTSNRILARAEPVKKIVPLNSPIDRVGRIRARFEGGLITTKRGFVPEDSELLPNLVPPVSLLTADPTTVETYKSFERFINETIPTVPVPKPPYFVVADDADYWFYRYTVGAFVPQTCQLLFYDESGDKYQLTVFKAFESLHKVHYNSSRPNIKAFEIDIVR